MKYKNQLSTEIKNRENKIEEEEQELIDLQESIKIWKKRLEILKGSASVELVSTILDKSWLDVSLFLDYNNTFRIMTQNESILIKLDDLFGKKLDRNWSWKNRIHHIFRY